MISGEEIVLPPEFSGPAQLVLFTRYGDPREPGWENKWITNWRADQLHPWFPKHELKIHKHFWPMLRDAFLELESLGLHTEIKSVDSCHELVPVHQGPVLSVHSWGAAIDFNKADNPTGSLGKWSDDFISTMSRHGIYCGQNWQGIKDPMHFAMVDGE
jgi:hypothetical protein